MEKDTTWGDVGFAIPLTFSGSVADFKSWLYALKVTLPADYKMTWQEWKDARIHV